MMAPMAEKLTQDRRREMTREALIDAAMDVFAEKGFHGCSLEEIASRAGFTRGAIYSNFEDKEALLLAAMDKVHQEFVDELAAAVQAALAANPEARSNRDTSRAAARASLQVARENPRLLLMQMELRLYAMREPAFGERLTALLEHWRVDSERMIRESNEPLGLTAAGPAPLVTLIAEALNVMIPSMALMDSDRIQMYEDALALGFGLLAYEPPDADHSDS